MFDVLLIRNTTHEFLDVTLDHNTSEIFQLNSGDSIPIHTNISVDDNAVPGTYKILLGVQLSDIAVSKFVTVTIE